MRWLLIPLAVLLAASTCNKAGGKAPPEAKKDAPARAPQAAPPAPSKVGAALSLADIRGIDFSSLPAPAQKELATVFTDEFCHCGCPHTLLACLKQHQGCRHARRMALLGAAQAAAGLPASEIIVSLGRYYQSFGEKRHAFKVDERMCMGPPDAKVTLVEFSDFECPFCAAARPLLEGFAKSRPEVRLCYLPFPLSGHPNAVPASLAALFARDHGKFWPMHDRLFEQQMSLSLQTYKQLASQLSLDGKALEKALESKKHVDELNAFKEQGRAAGVDATPAVFVNGRKLELPLDEESLRHTVEDELEWMQQSGWQAD